MQKVIYQYKLDHSGMVLQMPIGAEILTVETFMNEPVMWALIDPEAELEERSFLIVGTGVAIGCYEDSMMVYLGTVQLYGGQLVLHIFEALN